MRLIPLRGALALFAAALLGSCSEMPFSPAHAPVTVPQSSFVTPPQVVISQVYGGGGLGGSQYTNDFVELFNPGTTSVDITGWSVQYASATSTNWSMTTLAGSLAPGAYYLVQLGSSLLPTGALPTPDATGTTNINQSNGKVALVSNATRITSGTDCPAGVVDFVAYGTAASGIACADPTGMSLTSSTAALRLADGCTFTGSNSTDFGVGAPTPRNSASAAHPCAGQPSPPLAALDGPYAGVEGTGSIAMSGAASSDADGTVTSHAWDFGDGSTDSGVNVTHTYAQDGVFTVTLVVTDNDGLTSTITTTATVSNVAPGIAFSGASLLPGETFSTSGSFTDPGADSWWATVDYGDGSGMVTLPLNGKSFSLSHAYAAAGLFTVTVTVSDDDVTTEHTQTVAVASASVSVLEMIDNALALVDQMVADGTLMPHPYRNNLETARKQVMNGRPGNALAPLQNLLAELNAGVQSGKLSAQDAEPLQTLVSQIIETLS